MSQEPAQARIDYLLSLTTERDAELARALGISQPTVWRLRNRGIKRPGRYVPALEAYLSQRVSGEIDAVVNELRLLAGRNPRLLDLLRDLLGAIQVYSTQHVSTNEA